MDLQHGERLDCYVYFFAKVVCRRQQTWRSELPPVSHTFTYQFQLQSHTYIKNFLFE